MATILLYSASISQTGSSVPVASVASAKQNISASWSRTNVGTYKLTAESGGFFSNQSGSIAGLLSIVGISTTTSSYSLYVSGSDSSSLYLKTYSSSNAYSLSDNMLSTSSFQFSINIVY